MTTERVSERLRDRARQELSDPASAPAAPDPFRTISKARERAMLVALAGDDSSDTVRAAADQVRSLVGDLEAAITSPEEFAEGISAAASVLDHGLVVRDLFADGVRIAAALGHFEIAEPLLHLSEQSEEIDALFEFQPELIEARQWALLMLGRREQSSREIRAEWDEWREEEWVTDGNLTWRGLRALAYEDPTELRLVLEEFQTRCRDARDEIPDSQQPLRSVLHPSAVLEPQTGAFLRIGRMLGLIDEPAEMGAVNLEVLWGLSP